MSKSLVAELFVPRERCTLETMQALLDGFTFAGFQFERDGQGGQLWTDSGGGLELQFAATLEDAQKALEDSLVWSVSLRKVALPLVGDSIDLLVGVEREREPPTTALGRVHLSLSPWPKAPTKPMAFQLYISWVLLACSFVHPCYGWAGGNLGLFGNETSAVSMHSVERIEPQPLEWLNVYGAPYVDSIGLARLSSAPAWHVDFAANGAIAVTVAPDPEKVSREDASAVASHLGVPVILPT